MTESEYRTAADHVIYLTSCAVRRQIPDARRIGQMNLEQVYEAALFHQLGAAAGMSLDSAGHATPQFREIIAAAQKKTVLLDHDRTVILARLEQAGIWYMPLKGVILKDLYPRFGMREMADNDILIDADRAEEIRNIMTELGFTVGNYGKGAHDTYYKKPVSNFEMHRMLFYNSENRQLDSYYSDIKKHLLKDEDRQYGYHLSNEDFYLYLIAHEYKHFSGGGTGLRSLLDTYVLLHSLPLDWNYVKKEARAAGIADFEKQNRALAQKLFDGEPLSETQKEMLDQFLFDGTYGSRARGIDKKIARKGRLNYSLYRLFPPREYMQRAFPSLKKIPFLSSIPLFLYPFLWVVRLGRGILLSKGTALYEIRFLLNVDSSKKHISVLQESGSEANTKTGSRANAKTGSEAKAGSKPAAKRAGRKSPEGL